MVCLFSFINIFVWRAVSFFEYFYFRGRFVLEFEQKFFENIIFGKLVLIES